MPWCSSPVIIQIIVLLADVAVDPWYIRLGRRSIYDDVFISCSNPDSICPFITGRAADTSPLLIQVITSSPCHHEWLSGGWGCSTLFHFLSCFFSTFIRRPSRYQSVFWNRRRHIMIYIISWLSMHLCIILLPTSIQMSVEMRPTYREIFFFPITVIGILLP